MTVAALPCRSRCQLHYTQMMKKTIRIGGGGRRQHQEEEAEGKESYEETEGNGVRDDGGF